MKNIMLIGLLGIGLMAAPAAQAQPVRFGVSVGVGPAWGGPAPACAYGYYDYSPYPCAPYGYYGPQWFSGGLFIGAGPWYHGAYGRPGFYGRPGYYNGYRSVGRPGNYGRPGFEARGGFRSGPVGRTPAGNGFHGAPNGNAFHGGGSFHGGHR